MSKNLSESTVAVAPTPQLSGLTLTVATGHGSRFLPGPLVVWPANVDPSPDNAEFVTVQSVAGDVLTLTARAAESSTAKSIATGWQIAQGLTARTWDALVASVAGKANSDDVAAVLTTATGRAAAFALTLGG